MIITGIRIIECNYSMKEFNIAVEEKKCRPWS